MATRESNDPTPTLLALKDRFIRHPNRHPGLEWSKFETAILSDPSALNALTHMDLTGGEPDVVCFFGDQAQIALVDCCPESPAGRRSLCYDHASRIGRKNAPPAGSAWEMAEAIGVQLLTEAEYAQLQALGEFDLKTSSWLSTPDSIRRLGGAIFGDRRFGRVFTYHNGADSYYASRGFRGKIENRS